MERYFKWMALGNTLISCARFTKPGDGHGWVLDNGTFEPLWTRGEEELVSSLSLSLKTLKILRHVTNKFQTRVDK